MAPEKKVQSPEPKKSENNNFEAEKLQKEFEKLFEEIGDQDGFEGLDKKEYTEKYSKLKSDLQVFGQKLKQIEFVELSPELEEKKNSLIDAYVKVANQFNLIIKPEKIKPNSKPVPLMGLEGRSGFKDITLNAQEITTIKVGKYLANSGNNDYFEVSIPGKGNYILRINNNKGGDEVALLPVPENLPPKQLVDMIRAGEMSVQFQDVEIDKSASIMNLLPSGVGLGAGAASGVGLAAGASGAGIGLGSLTLGTLSIPGVNLLVGATAGVGLGIGAMTDLDLTTDRAKALGLYKKLEVVKSYYS